VQPQTGPAYGANIVVIKRCKFTAECVSVAARVAEVWPQVWPKYGSVAGGCHRLILHAMQTCYCQHTRRTVPWQCQHTSSQGDAGGIHETLAGYASPPIAKCLAPCAAGTCQHPQRDRPIQPPLRRDEAHRSTGRKISVILGPL
jgi:hypothetical protein